MKDTFPKDAIRPDPRTPEAKAKDHIHKERYAGLPAVWLEKPQSTWKLPSQRNQGTSLSCLFQSAATAIEVLLKKIISAGVYKLRADPTQGGTWQGDVGDVLKNKHTILESVCPSQFMGEVEMNAIKLPTFLDIAITNYQFANPKIIDEIAEAIQAYGNCGLVFDSNHDEWQITPVYLGTPITFGHSIEAVDFTLINNVKHIICMDSAGKDSSPTGIRKITQDFLTHRCRGAMYFTGVKVTPVPAPTPSPTPSIAPFLVDMSVGQNSLEIARLQAFLNKLNISNFPLVVDGKYGQATQQVVFSFQQKYVANQSLWTYIVVMGSRGRYCSTMTRTALNKLLT